MVNHNPHSTICNSEPKPSIFGIHLILNPSQFTLLTLFLHLTTHLKMWINCISVNPPASAPLPRVNETCSLYTSCDHLLHLDSPSLSSEFQTHQALKVDFVPDLEEPLESNSFHQQMSSVYNMTCSYSIKR